MGKRTGSKRWRVPDLSEIRQQVEDVALHLVIADPAAANYATAIQEWIVPLERIREDAAACQAGQVAAAADATIEIVRHLAADGPQGADRLQEGFARLQQAIDHDAQQTRS